MSPSQASLDDTGLSDDAFLGGALKILQPKSGYRAGLDAVMLAAAVPSGCRHVLDVGAGVGTAGLCLAVRDESANVTLLEREPMLVRIADENIERNGLAKRVRVVTGDIRQPSDELDAIGIRAEAFDHIIANPPFHDTGKGTTAREPMKARAHEMPEESLERWARFMARAAGPGAGTTVIHKAQALAPLLAVLDGRFGALKVLPLHSYEAAPAHRIIVQGTKASRAPLSLLPGFVLHAPDGSFTPRAEAILRSGAALTITL